MVLDVLVFQLGNLNHVMCQRPFEGLCGSNLQAATLERLDNLHHLMLGYHPLMQRV